MHPSRLFQKSFSADPFDEIERHQVSVVGYLPRAPLELELFQAVPVIEKGSLFFFHSVCEGVSVMLRGVSEIFNLQ